MAEYNEDGTRTDAQLAIDFKTMGDSVDLIVAVVAGDEMADEIEFSPAQRQDCVDRNVAHLETMKAMTDWGSENMTATTNAITAGKGYTAS